MKPTAKAPETLPFGFKRITAANQFEPDDHPAYRSGLRGDPWLRACLKPKLEPSVPEEVVLLFESARGAMVYGQYFLPLAALATEEGFRVLEAGVRHRCRQLGLGRKKSAPPDAIPEKPYPELVKALHRSGKIPSEDLDAWKAMVTLRNTFSHRTTISLCPRHQAIAQLAYIADLLNRLFSP